MRILNCGHGQYITVAEKGQVKKKIPRVHYLEISTYYLEISAYYLRVHYLVSRNFDLLSRKSKFRDTKSKFRDNKSKFRDNELSGIFFYLSSLGHRNIYAYVTILITAILISHGRRAWTNCNEIPKSEAWQNVWKRALIIFCLYIEILRIHLCPKP